MTWFQTCPPMNRFITDCQGNAPWITNRLFDQEYEKDRLTTHDYAVDMAIKKTQNIDGTMLIDCIELPLHSESDFRTAIEVVMKTKLKNYCKMFILLQPGDWLAQFYTRRVVHSTTNATIKSSLVLLLGPLHVSLNGQDNVFKVFFELLFDMYRSIFSEKTSHLPWKTVCYALLQYQIGRQNKAIFNTISSNCVVCHICKSPASL